MPELSVAYILSNIIVWKMATVAMAVVDTHLQNQTESIN